LTYFYHQLKKSDTFKTIFGTVAMAELKLDPGPDNNSGFSQKFWTLADRSLIQNKCLQA
jgi:hypothetical protein